jgi:hypothetical protein
MSKVNATITEHFDYMKSVKDSLLDIIKDVVLSNGQHTPDILEDAIIRMNKIVTHTYFFIKLYIIYLYDNDICFPKIDKKFVKNVMNVVSSRNGKLGRKPNGETNEIIQTLTEFYDEHYKETINYQDIVNDDRLSNILRYEAVDIVTNINTNIKEHYLDHVRKFVNVKFGWKTRIAQINSSDLSNEDKKQQRRLLSQEFQQIKHDILNVKIKNNFEDDDIDYYLTCPEKYHDWIYRHKFFVIPHKKSYSKKNVAYDVCCNPQDYLASLIYINNQLNKLGTDDNPIKLFNIIPLRTSIIPKYITIDTTSLVSLFIETGSNEYYKKIIENQKELWGNFFRTNKRIFRKKGYNFNYMIKTDGIACSILFVKKNKKGKSITMTKNDIRQLDKLKESNDKNYIENHDDIAELLRLRNYVLNDPNKSHLMHCIDKNDIKFAYTQKLRSRETKYKKYLRITDNINKETIIGATPEEIQIDNETVTIMLGGETVKELEATLSKYNSKSCNFQEFVDYLKIKNDINFRLYEQYQKEVYRKLMVSIYKYPENRKPNM